MNEIKSTKRAIVIGLAIIALVMTTGTALAQPQPDAEGETQSLVIIGCALAIGIAGISAAIGLMVAGTSAAAVTCEKPALFGKVMVLQILPMTQSVYGLLTAILLMMGAGLLGGEASVDLGNPMIGLSAIGIGLIVGLTGISAVNQGFVASASISAVARNPKIAARVIIFTVMPETIAIFGLLIAILLMTGLQFL